jgi:hypothetical protein
MLNALKTSRPWLSVLSLALALLAGGAFLFSTGAVAKGPPPGKGGGGGGDGGGGDAPTGVIYFRDGWTDLTYRINADGSNQTMLPLNAYGSLSAERHAGAFWFLQTRVIEGEFYPDGDPRRELFAVREDDENDVLTVQLTSDPRLEIAPGGNPRLHLRWASLSGVKDMLATFGAIRWDLNTSTVVGAGIYEAPIWYDDQGNVDGLVFAPDPDDPVVTVPVDERDTDGDGVADQWRLGITGLDYAPDGSALTFSTSGNLPQTDDPLRLFVVDLSVETPTPVAIAESESVGAPAWSHDGTRIAFNSFDGIATVSPDGSSLNVAVSGKTSKRSQVLVRFPAWSPDDGHLAFWRHESNFQKGTSSVDLFRATSSGRDVTNLTNDGGFDARPLGWRD